MKKKKYLKETIVFLPVVLMVLGQYFSKVGSIQLLYRQYWYAYLFFSLGYLFLIIRGFVWIYVLRFFQLSYAYPFLSVNYLLVLCMSVLLFGEQVTIEKTVGTLFISMGVFINFFSSRKYEEYGKE